MEKGQDAKKNVKNHLKKLLRKWNKKRDWRSQSRSVIIR